MAGWWASRRAGSGRDARTVLSAASVWLHAVLSEAPALSVAEGKDLLSLYRPNKHLILWHFSVVEHSMSQLALTPEVLVLVAERFKALAEPARLQLLSSLRHGEMTVTELVARTTLGQANVSKHLQLLHTLGFVSRRKEGLFVYYDLADKRVFQLCDIMCGRLEVEMKARRRLLAR